jgi:nucleotide-binding universal stress UspA family protein
MADLQKRIVVGVDGSGPSKLALRWAARPAPVLDAGIDAMIVWDFPAGLGIAGLPDGWNPEADSGDTLDEALADAYGQDRPTDIRNQIRRGAPAKELLDASAKAEMLIVGSRGHSGFAGLLLGSVSNACAEHANCPVLVVHERTGGRIAPSPDCRDPVRGTTCRRAHQPGEFAPRDRNAQASGHSHCQLRAGRKLVLRLSGRENVRRPTPRSSRAPSLRRAGAGPAGASAS